MGASWELHCHAGGRAGQHWFGCIPAQEQNCQRENAKGFCEIEPQRRWGPRSWEAAKGRQRRWLTKPPETSPLIHLDSGTAVRAPWPTHLVIPTVVFVPGQKHILIHGRVTVAGRFESLAFVARSVPPSLDVVIDSLAAWEFRPASKDGVPIEVEAVLEIPAGGS